jgi:hypothetical protein
VELVYCEPELKEQGPKKAGAWKEGFWQVKQEENHSSTDAEEREACSKPQELAASLRKGWSMPALNYSL